MLPPQVIDQIAAGEVVERPASVVKELVENALDAGAASITVEIEGGGKTRIRVVDDGCGMTASQAELAVERHATSKLRSIDDLFGIRTMGFRGEALASIAAVSRLTLTTRASGHGVGGTRIEIHGGKRVSVGDAGAPVGTAIEVADLLFNVPARQKFLKGDATETAHITDALTKLALAHPEVGFQLRHNGRLTLSAPAPVSALERVKVLLGARLGPGLAEVMGEERGISVRAYLAAPEAAQSTSRGLQLFVGRRAVRDRGLLHATSMGYGELVPRGRYPVAVVLVEVPDPELDVNVHPQKLEVRFSDPQRVYAAVRHTVTRGVAEAQWVSGRSAGAESILRPWTPAGLRAPRASELAERYAADTSRALGGFRVRAPESRGRGLREAGLPLSPMATPAFESPPARTPVLPPHPAPIADPVSATAPPLREAELGDTVDGFFGHLRYIGQLDRTYLVCEGNGEMLLIDQHAAHERVAFHRLKERHGRRGMPIQTLLFPLVMEVPAAQVALCVDRKDELLALGFRMGPCEGDSISVSSVPAELREGEVEEVLRATLAELDTQDGTRAVQSRIDNVLATIACHSVVRAGDELGPREAEALLASMDGVPSGGYCPHGRPVVVRMQVSEIARRFGR